MTGEQKMVLIMACGVLGSCFLFIFLLIFWPYQLCESASKYAELALGAVLSILTGMIGYFWGSSSGSTAKSKTIDKMVESQERQIEKK